MLEKPSGLNDFFHERVFNIFINFTGTDIVYGSIV